MLATALGVDLLIVDELGFVPFDRQGGEPLFNLLAARYEAPSTILTTNLAFRRVGPSLWRREDDDGAARPTRAPRRHPDDERRLLPDEEQGEDRILDRIYELGVGPFLIAEWVKNSALGTLLDSAGRRGRGRADDLTRSQ